MQSWPDASSFYPVPLTSTVYPGLHLLYISQQLEKMLLLPTHDDPRVSGDGIATYPRLCHASVGPEHLIADSWLSISSSSRILFGIADGIGHGTEAQKAAVSSLAGLMAHLVSSFDVKDKMFGLQEAFNYLTDAFGVAQTVLVNATEEMTAMTAGILLPIASASEEKNFLSTLSPSSSVPISQSSPSLSHSAPRPSPASPSSPSFPVGFSSSSSIYDFRWGLLCISVGDCKVFRLSHVTEQVTEVTADDSTKVSVRDPGGHLGSQCLLSNWMAHFCAVEEGDYIICMSDGVHDNLDPEVLRISPRVLGLSEASWRDVPPECAAIAKKSFREIRLAQILGLRILQPHPPLSPSLITSKILDYAHKITEDLRSGEEKGAILQRDWNIMSEEERLRMKREVTNLQKNSPGKYDHATCVTISVNALKGNSDWIIRDLDRTNLSQSKQVDHAKDISKGEEDEYLVDEEDDHDDEDGDEVEE